MRVLMLSWEYPPRIIGGISRVVHDLAQKLGEQDHEIHVITCWEPSLEAIEKDKNVYVHRVKTCDIKVNNFLDWALHLNFAMIEYSIKLLNNIGEVNIIHAHDWIVAHAAIVLKHAYKIPLVSTIHATEHGRNQGIHNNIQRYINDMEWLLSYESWKVICNSHYMEREIKHLFQLTGNKVEVIPNGIYTNRFDGIIGDKAFRRNFASDNEKIVFFVGRLVQEKGVHILLDAIPKILGLYNDVKFVIVGKGDQLNYLKDKAHYMGIGQKVYFTGYMNDNDLQKLYKCIDIAVFPSLYEPFGIVVLEAMISGIPVVTTDIGGLGEIVEHAVDGMKAYTGNAVSLADCILELLYNPELCIKVKTNALDKVKNKYNWDLIATKTLQVYQQIIAERQHVEWISEDFSGIINNNFKKN